MAAVAAAPAAASVPMSTNAVGGESNNKNAAVLVVVTKSSTETKLGLGILQKEGGITVTSIAPDSLLAGTKLKVGMKIDSINGKNFSTPAQCVDFLKTVVGQVSIVASIALAPPEAIAAVHSALAAAKAATAAVAAPPAIASVNITKENSIPVKNAGFEVYEEEMPWERDDFRPMTAKGKQKTPNVIRNELQKYIDQ